MRIEGYAGKSQAAVVVLGLILFAGTGHGQSAPAPTPAMAPVASVAQVAPIAPVAPFAPVDPVVSTEPCLDLGELSGEMGRLDDLDTGKLEAEVDAMRDRIESATAAIGPEIAEKMATVQSVLAGKEAALAAAQSAAEAAGSRVDQAVTDDMAQRMSLLDDSSNGWLGLDIAEVTPESAQNLKLPAVRGVVVKRVEEKSPADQAGLKENDVITEYEGQVVEGTAQFRRLIRETPPGRSVAVKLIRAGAEQTITVTVAERRAVFERWEPRILSGLPDSHPEIFTFSVPDGDLADSFSGAFGGHSPMLGIQAEELRGQLGEYFGAPNGEGVLVRDVRAGSAAGKAGLKAGDVITKVDGRGVKTLSDLREQMRQASDDKPVQLTILRRGAEMTLPVTVEKPRSTTAPGIMHRTQM
ncbi:MAG: PDZ domain-containing protein [Candidatus Acidiferrales bacterium]